MATTGFSILFGGPAFSRGDFVLGPPLVGFLREREQQTPQDHGASVQSYQFADLREDYEGLDPLTEALDLLRTHMEDFLQLSALPGVTVRHLSIVGDAAACTVEMAAEDIAVLHDLRMSLSVAPYL